MCEILLLHPRGQLQRIQDVMLSLNTLDRPRASMAEMYLSVLGTSAEDSLSGEVGLGNQVKGFIALNRPRRSEAAAGKNPLIHVGKIYNGVARLLAHKLHTQIPGLREVVVWLCTASAVQSTSHRWSRCRDPPHDWDISSPLRVIVSHRAFSQD